MIKNIYQYNLIGTNLFGILNWTPQEKVTFWLRNAQLKKCLIRQSILSASVKTRRIKMYWTCHFSWLYLLPWEKPFFLKLKISLNHQRPLFVCLKFCNSNLSQLCPKRWKSQCIQTVICRQYTLTGTSTLKQSFNKYSIHVAQSIHFNKYTIFSNWPVGFILPIRPTDSSCKLIWSIEFGLRYSLVGWIKLYKNFFVICMMFVMFTIQFFMICNF